MVSLALISSSMSIVNMTTKWTVTNVLIGKTISTKSATVENDKNSLIVEYSNIVILSSLE